MTRSRHNRNVTRPLATRGRRRAAVTAVIALTAALSLAGCGRRGSLEPPSDAASRRDPAVPMVKNEKGREVPDRPFFLDPLL